MCVSTKYEKYIYIYANVHEQSVHEHSVHPSSWALQKTQLAGEQLCLCNYGSSAYAGRIFFAIVICARRQAGRQVGWRVSVHIRFTFNLSAYLCINLFVCLSVV